MILPITLLLLSYLHREGISGLKMTDVIQSTASQSGTIAESRSTLMNTLDDLLEHYLNLLHEYQRLRSNLADYFSSVH